VAAVPGARRAEDAEEVVEPLRRRTGGRAMRLITGDEHRPDPEAILQAYGVEAPTTPGGRPVRAPRAMASPGLCSATTPKVRRLGRVAAVVIRLTFGAAAGLAAADKASAVSRAVDVALLERQHRTDRRRNAREARRT
jgi:hypothetical protein